MIPKFRAWDKVEKEWLEIKLLGFWEDNELWYLEIESGELLFEDDLGVKWELSQSTGLKDKNGVEIFEEDILKIFVLGNEGAIAKVIFKNGMFGIEDDMYGYGYDKGLYSLHQILSLRDVEILGNKFEHPNLLEE